MKRIHMAKAQEGEPDFRGFNQIRTMYNVRLCDEVPEGDMTEDWKRVTCRDCLKRKPRKREEGAQAAKRYAPSRKATAAFGDATANKTCKPRAEGGRKK